MNFIFRNYPAHPWMTDWVFEPRNCSSTIRLNGGQHFFRSRDTVGRLGPDLNDPVWLLQVPVPQNSRINLLFNGFCAFHEKGPDKVGAEVLVAEPGVIWGRIHNIPRPHLASETPLQTGDDYEWLESGHESVYLCVRSDHFCLISKSAVFDEARRIADSYLNKDFEPELKAELDRRKGIDAVAVEMTHHDALAAICMESLMRALRPPEGSIPLEWSQSSLSDSPRLDVNELCPLALAWRMMDPETAENLVLCALRLQTNAGAIPVVYAPHTTHSVLEAPKPLLARTAEAIWEVRKNEQFLNAVVPLLRRHLQWMLHHYDPKRRGMHCWKNSTEPIFPEEYKSDLATADLTALLLSEIDAYERLSRSSSAPATTFDLFKEERGILKTNLLEQFWDADQSAFTRAFLHDIQVSENGSGAFIPLLWKDLPATYKDAVTEKMADPDALPGNLNVLSWSNSSIESNRFPLLQHFVLFLCLKEADPKGSILSDFTRVTLQSFLEWHAVSIEKNNRFHINAATAAYILNIQSARQYRYIGEGSVSGFLFRFLKKIRADLLDVLIVAGTLTGIFGTHAIYKAIRTPPALNILSAEMNNAYEEQDHRTTLKKSMQIIRYYPDEAARARLLAANIYMLHGHVEEAGRLYTELREKYPDSPGPMIALGLTCQIQGRLEEAEKHFFEFCYLFDEIFPEVVEEINIYRQTMREGFKIPAKWQEIYRYQLMHEL